MQQNVASQQQTRAHKFPWKLALLTYGLSYCFLLLFLKSYFWDDWYTYFTLSDNGTKNYWNGYGYLPIHGFFQVDILDSRPELFRLVTLVCFFIAGWCLFHILSTVKLLHPEQVRLITILFLILPINSARVAMGQFVYSYSFFFFFLAWYLLVTKRSLLVRSLSIPLFLLSFSTLSLITFFAIPSLHFLYTKLSVPNHNKTSAYMSTAFLVSLSPLYWIISRRINPPQGAALAYLTPKPLGIARGALLLICCLILILWFLKSNKKYSPDSNRYGIIAAGITITAIGAFPYVVSGRLVDVSEWLLNFVPRASDWDSRHQLLLGLGFALIIVGLIGEVDSAFKRHCRTFLVGLFVAWNITYMHAYYLDSLKQDQLIVAIQKSDELKSSRVIMFRDTTARFNARGRGYRSYEWNGILTKAFGDSSRSVIDMGYVNCNDPLTPVPDTLLTITARNGRIESTLTRDIGIELSVESIQPCG